MDLLKNSLLPTPHKTKPGGSSSMTGKLKYKNILAVDTRSGCTPGQFLYGDRYLQVHKTENHGE